MQSSYLSYGSCILRPVSVLHNPEQLSVTLKLILMTPYTANRSLEDLDEYYRGNPSLIVTKDKDAISSGRPRMYMDREADMVMRQRSVADGTRKEAKLGMTEVAEVAA